MTLRSGRQYSMSGTPEEQTSNVTPQDQRVEQLIRLLETQTNQVQALHATLASTSTAPVPPSVTNPSSGHSRIRVADLPEFRGTRTTVDTDQFLLELKDLFSLHCTPEHDKGTYAAQAINKQQHSPAAAWLADRRTAKAFVNSSNPDVEIDFQLFCVELKSHFYTPLARRFQLEDTWDRFVQKGSVEDHYVKFIKVLKQLRELQVRHPDDLVASKFLRSLKQEIRELVVLRISSDSIPELKDIYHRALESEYQAKPQSAGPRFGYMGQKPADKRPPFKPSDYQNKSNQRPKSDVYCAYHKSTDHSTEECPKVQELKAAGKWRSALK